MIIYLLLALQTVTTPTTTIKSEKMFTLGMTREAMVEMFGAPVMHYAPSAHAYFTPQEYPVAVRVYPNMTDVFRRKTSANEYEFRFFYDVDRSTSRLNPEIRLGRVDVRLDKAKPARAILEDLAEARQICRAGCRLLGLISVGVSAELIVYQESPTIEERLLAQNMASGWRSPPSGRYVLAIHLTWEDRTYSNRSANVSWATQPMDEARFSVANSEHEYEMSARYRTPVIVDLGHWKPD